MSEKPKSQLDIAFENFEEAAAGHNVVRKEMIDALREDVKKIGRVTEYDKAMMVTAKMSMYNTLSGLLKDVENTHLAKIKLKMQKSEQESGGSLSSAVVALLKAIRADEGMVNTTQPVKSDEQIAAELNKEAGERGIEIMEGELETGHGDVPQKLPDVREPEKKPPEEKPKDPEGKEASKFAF